MGCVCSKGTFAHEFISRNHGKNKDLNAKKCLKRLGPSVRGEETIVEGNGVGNDATARLISDPAREGNTSSGTNSSDEGEKQTDITVKTSKTPTQRNLNMHSGSIREQGQPRIASLTKGERGAQIVAGWPSWLVSVAAEAISGWLPRKADSFERMDKIGQGTYSSVYRARDLKTNKIVALKKVRFANMDPESVRFMAREILVLRRLDHPNVMKLKGLITSRVSGSLYLVFDYMEHDLAGLAAKPGVKFTETQIKCYMQQLLLGLEHCHNHGVIHRDIKGSNLLIDNNGKLKIGDFGLATFIQSPQTQPLTSRVVTLWYRPPELLLGSTKYGVSVDLWSSGCILAEIFTGKPIMPGRTEVEQLHKIFKLCGSPSEEYWKRSKLPHATIFKPQHPYKRCVAETFKDLPSSALSLLEVLLAVEPECRGTASVALQNEFFTMEPLPCSPSSLPKYPPSKELDTKFRNEESKRRRAAAEAAREQESVGRSMKESKAIPAPNANAELQSSILKRQGLGNLKSVSEQFNPEEESHSIFSTKAPRGASLSGFCNSGQSMHSNEFGTSQNMDSSQAFTGLGQTESVRNGAEFKKQRSYQHLGASHLSRFSNSVAIRGDSHYDISGDSSVHFQGNYNHGDETSENLLDRANLSNKKHGQPHVKNSAMSYAAKNNRVHFSGPLMPSGGNVEEILKEHERQIQNAVRKARVDKVKLKKATDEHGQTQSLLHFVQNHR